MGTKYKYNPIVEALCEFRFEPQEEWDLTIPGLVFEQVREIFPNRRRARTVSVELSPEQANVLEVNRVQFVREDETAMVQVGPNLVAVNQLKPYSSWEEFSPLIMRGLEAYTAVAGPQTINRIALRYINHIRFPGRRVELEDYFQFRPTQGPDLPEDFIAFVTAIMFPFDGERDLLRTHLATLPFGAPDTSVISLDLEYFLARPGEVSLVDVPGWIQTAHARIESTFEACMTPRLRTLFQKGGE